VRRWVRTNRYVNLIGATADDAREIMIYGESGILEVCPDHERPEYLAHRRLLQWPNGAISYVYTADEPDRLRGKQHMKLWCDELASWRYPEAWDQAQFGLRLGDRPRACITTTPRPRPFLKALIEHPDCVVVRGTTYENRPNLAPMFFDSIISRYQGTSLGQQEIEGRLIAIQEGAWFTAFDGDVHVGEGAEYVAGRPVIIGIDAGTSRTTAATYFQTERVDAHRVRFTVFGDYLAVDRYSGENARQILSRAADLAPGATIREAWIDPAANQRTSIGVAATEEYRAVFGRLLDPAPGGSGSVTDGLDTILGLIERRDLAVHPRATHLIDGFENYLRAGRPGQWLDIPAANQSPWEDSLDSFRYGVVGHWPEGRRIGPALRQVHQSRVM
jgi:hypothetical protein